MRDALMRLLEPPIEALGFELLELEFAQAGRGGTLRIYIDRGAADKRGEAGERGASGNDDGAGDDPSTDGEVPSQGGISVDDCAAVSHVVSQILDAEDPIKGHYTLEVSSPGVDRVLRKRAHFERFLGERVFVELKLPIEGRRRFAGTLKSVLGEAIVVEVDGRAHELPLERIQKARLRPE
jgi:ribosome maturation factor RimP